MRKASGRPCRSSQSVTVGDQDHGRISMSVAAVLAGIVHEFFDLAGGQVFPNCTVYSVWWAGIASHEPVDEVLFDSAQDLLGYHERIGSPAFKLDKSNPPETVESSAAGPDQATDTAASAAIAAAPFGTPSPVQAFQPAAAS